LFLFAVTDQGRGKIPPAFFLSAHYFPAGGTILDRSFAARGFFRAVFCRRHSSASAFFCHIIISG
jgi:hypothetical protein